MYYRFSNTLIGFINLITLLASVPIIGGGLWMSRSSATCQTFIQTPLVVIGFIVLIVSLAGFIGACFDIYWVLWVYLLVMLGLIGSLMILTVFGFVVTGRGGGVAVPNKYYREYLLGDYTSWLRHRVDNNPQSWMSIKSCLLGSNVCAKIVTWTPYDYQTKDMSPIQSGCCKPPTACVYNTATPVAQDPDCYKWNNSPAILCYDCDSCKAGVLEDIRRSWHKLSMLNIVMVVVLICIYSIGCCAFQNSKRGEGGGYPYWHNRLQKIRPRWNYNW